tara:strand:+ start:300 stop:524 length:225 start_codon:yes stop_codon:yes gene_type:complete
MAWSFTETKYNNLITRVTRLEDTLNDTIKAVGRLASINQIHELLVVIQTQIDSLNTSVTALEARVTSIEEEPLS